MPYTGTCPASFGSGSSYQCESGTPPTDDGGGTLSASCYTCAPGDDAFCGPSNPFTGGVSGGSNAPNTVVCNILSIYNSVDTAIFIIGLVLMILGGALYAGSHVMPGQSKGTMQGYGMGMVLGGVIGIIIAVIAPYIFSLITGVSISAFQAGTNPFTGQSIVCP